MHVYVLHAYTIQSWIFYTYSRNAFIEVCVRIVMAVPRENEIIRDLDKMREAIITENREIVSLFASKYRQHLPREMYKRKGIPVELRRPTIPFYSSKRHSCKSRASQSHREWELLVSGFVLLLKLLKYCLNSYLVFKGA